MHRIWRPPGAIPRRRREAIRFSSPGVPPKVCRAFCKRVCPKGSDLVLVLAAWAPEEWGQGALVEAAKAPEANPGTSLAAGNQAAPVAAVDLEVDAVDQAADLAVDVADQAAGRVADRAAEVVSADPVAGRGALEGGLA